MHAADPFERLPSAAAPIFRLPYEVLEEIVDISSPASQILLCRVSKLFRSLTIRSLYRDISLTSPADTVSCCRTLAGSLEAATCVKSLSISYRCALLASPLHTWSHGLISLPVTRNFLSSFYGLISKALRSLTNLQSLKLLVLDPSLVFALRYCTHPFLHLFECYLGLTTPLIAFLNRHPRIFYLQISPHYNEHQALSVPLWTQSTKAPLPLLPPVVHLPRLEYFVGNSHSLPIITSYAALRAAFVFWDDSAVPSFTPSTPSMNAPDPLSEAILPLEMTSTQTLNLLSCRRKGWNLDLLDIVSERLPFIYALSITNLLHDAGDGDVEGSYPSQVRSCRLLNKVTCTHRVERLQVMLERIKQSLGRFHNLQSFHLNCVGGDGNWQPNVAVNEVDTAALEARMDRDFKTVTLWGEACPSLTELILPCMFIFCVAVDLNGFTFAL